MSVLDAPGTGDELLELNLVAAGIYPTAAEATAHGLVIVAQGFPYWLDSTPEGFRVLIEPRAAEIARAHLAAYDRESLHWPPKPIRDPWQPSTGGLLTPLLWASVVLALFHFTTPTWIASGALDPRAMLANGEWWRAVSALFLHADAAHVLSNTLAGLFVFSAVVATFGVARGWTLLLGAGVAGNLAVAAINYSGAYSSVGASTAIFAGVGLLSGRAVRIAWTSSHPHRIRLMFAPLAAGATVLALYGAGAQHVDLGAHLTGFVAGLILGFMAGASGLSRRKSNFSSPIAASPHQEG